MVGEALATAELVRELSRPEAYPHATPGLAVVETHISIVFLAGDFVYKVKKPLDLGFLDFRTLESRRHFCEEEVRLNARLAPDVYLGVVTIVRGPRGLRVGGPGTPLEFAVRMKRLPAEATLLARLQRGQLDAALLTRVAHRLARFHAEAAAGEEIDAYGALVVVARNARENFEQTRLHIGHTVHGEVHERARDRSEEWLQALGDLIEARARAGVPRDTHGDLHLQHIYVLEDQAPPGDLAIIDCIEFNARFRFADPVADMAFLTMDLVFRGRADLAEHFVREYFTARDDPEGEYLLPFYLAYRALVRAKVEGILALSPDAADATRSAARLRARAYWLLALGALEAPEGRPCLILVGGLPGTGKSTLARLLAEAVDLSPISSDRTRKRLAGLAPDQSAAAEFGEGIYAAEWSERTYQACLTDATALLERGGRVVVDASFREERWRRAFLDRAEELAVPALFLHCQASTEVVRYRIMARRGDVSDADWSIHEAAAARWERLTDRTERVAQGVPTDGTPEQVLALALRQLRQRGLAAQPGASTVAPPSA